MLKNSIQIGVIGAIRKMDVFDLPKVGQKISTIVEVKEEVFGMTLASAKVLQGDHILASTEMKIAVKQK
jgi:hypothetical protein